MKRFDKNQYFFVIDPKNMDAVKDRFYGYAIVDEGIVTDCADSRKLTGEGTYVAVFVSSDRIEIRQDYLGSFGLYLYREHDFWAVSNSFWLLAEHLCNEGHPLTKNDAFVDHMLVPYMNCAAYSETPYHEITCMARNAVVTVDKQAGTVGLQFIDYGENSIWPDTKEGLEILDRWFLKWTHIIKDLSDKTSNIFADLSGGFDSRMAFVPVLKAGVNNDRITIRSIVSDTYCFAEDYKIASKMATYFGFALNDVHHQNVETEDYSIAEALEISWYIKWLMHNQLYFYRYCPSWKEPHYYISGHGGESVREYWSARNGFSCEKRLKACKKAAWRFSPRIEKKLSATLDSVFRKTFDEIGSYYAGKVHHADGGVDFFRDTYCRYHFGKQNVEGLCGNSYILQPLLDPIIQKLALSGEKCHDDNFLLTLMMGRYCPELLSFPFEGGRRMRPKTVAYAGKINRKLPYDSSDMRTSFGCCPNQMTASEKGNVSSHFDADMQNKEIATVESVEKYLREVFCSRAVRNKFASLYSDEIRRCADKIYHSTRHYPLQLGYLIIASVVMDDFKEINSVQKDGDFHIKKLLDSYIESGKDMEVSLGERAQDGFYNIMQFLRRGWSKMFSVMQMGNTSFKKR